MATMPKLMIKVETTFCVVFFPVAKFTRVGSCSVLKVLGIPVYQSIGMRHLLFGVFHWSSEVKEDGLESV